MTLSTSSPGAGRLDLLLHDPEEPHRFEVEVQLGPANESHIIRIRAENGGCVLQQIASGLWGQLRRRLLLPRLLGNGQIYSCVNNASGTIRVIAATAGIDVLQ